MKAIRLFLVFAAASTVISTVAVHTGAHTSAKMLTVKLDCDFNQVRKDGQYDWEHIAYSRAKVPEAECEDEQEVRVRFFEGTEENNSYPDMKKKIADHDHDCEPAPWPVLMAIGAQHPEFQRDKHVVGLGSIWDYTAQDGDIRGMRMKFVSYLDADDEGRNLGFDYPLTWTRGTYFPAVCKKDNEKKEKDK